jgi:hypothetical protein
MEQGFPAEILRAVPSTQSIGESDGRKNNERKREKKSRAAAASSEAGGVRFCAGYRRVFGGNAFADAVYADYPLYR